MEDTWVSPRRNPGDVAAHGVFVRRGTADDWDAILDVLATANFDAIGSSEMPSFPIEDCFVATRDDLVVGVGGYRIVDEKTGKTTLLAVHPDWRGRGIGEMLQNARLDHMKKAGIRLVYTNADDTGVIEWLKTRYGFRPTGRIIAKTCSFGRADKAFWTNLVLEL